MLVFVYGTLLSGEGNNKRLLQNSESKLLGGIIIDIPFEMHDMGSFPALIESDINTITGEVWDVSENVFSSLDRLECYPRFYDRKLIKTYFGDAWVYFCNDAEEEPLIEYGNWKEYKNAV